MSEQKLTRKKQKPVVEIGEKKPAFLMLGRALTILLFFYFINI